MVFKGIPCKIQRGGIVPFEENLKGPLKSKSASGILQMRSPSPELPLQSNISTSVYHQNPPDFFVRALLVVPN